MSHRESTFSINSEFYYKGLVDDTESWNGYFCPLFTREECKRMIADEPEVPFVYDEGTDTFTYDGEDVYEGVELEGKTYFNVGACSWGWVERVNQDD